MIRFYAPDIERIPVLPEVESGHCVRVLRKRPGDIIEVVDGRGGLFRCELVSDSPKAAAVQIVERESLPKIWTPEITVAVAPTKHADRMEWLVEKLVEIGIDRFVPLRCDRSERKELKRERIEKIAVSAMKQSPEAGRSAAQRFVGYCDAETPRVLLPKAYAQGSDVMILIGPEGDFSPAEIEACLAGGFQAVTMGDNRLRTETAALMGVAIVHTVNLVNS